MRAMFFYGPDPTTVFEEINTWLEELDKNSRQIKVFDIKQTGLPPNAEIVNTELMHYDDVIENESDLVVSIWYDES